MDGEKTQELGSVVQLPFSSGPALSFACLLQTKEEHYEFLSPWVPRYSATNLVSKETRSSEPKALVTF